MRGSKALSDSQTGGLVNFFFDSAYGEDNPRSRYTRSFYQFGVPPPPPLPPPPHQIRVAPPPHALPAAARSIHLGSVSPLGAPLAGFDNYIESDLKDDQDKLVTDWWKEEDMRGLYSKNGRLSWNEIEPSAIITLGDILLNEFLEIIKVDGILAIVPIVAVFLIVWCRYLRETPLRTSPPETIPRLPTPSIYTVTVPRPPPATGCTPARS